MSHSSPPNVTGFTTPLTAANTNMDGTGTNFAVIAKPVTGPVFYKQVRMQPVGVNVQTVARFFINNGQTNETAENNRFWFEMDLPATNTLLADSAYPEQVKLVSLWLPASHRVLVTLGTAVAAGFVGTMIGGDYQYE